MKAHGDVDGRVHILKAMALGRGRVASPTLGTFTPGKSPDIHLKEVELTLGPVWTRRNEENLHPSNTQDRTWAVQPMAKPLHLCHLAHTSNINLLYI